MKIWYLIWAVVQLCVLVIPFWEPLSSRLIGDATDPKAFSKNLWMLASLQWGMTAFLNFIKTYLDDKKDKTASELERLVQKVEGPHVKNQRDDEFYNAFLEAAEKANSHVNICYFSAKAPSNSKEEVRKKYYKDLNSVIKRRKTVKFRRILKRSPGNEEWVRASMKEWQAFSNLSVRLLDEHLPPDAPDLSMALSVQIVDTEAAWLVAMTGHNRTGTYRDLYVKNADFAAAMEKYFERLWGMSTVVLDSGNPQKGWEPKE